MTKPILFNLTDAELTLFLGNMGQPKFRTKQIREWLMRGVPDAASMKNIPETLRRDLDAVAQTLPVKIIKKLQSADGETTKFLLELIDGETIECVLMRTTYGNSVCVSSQAGCAMGCRFCASTLLGLKRNLTANEIFAQILVAQWELRGDKFSDKPIRPNGDANDFPYEIDTSDYMLPIVESEDDIPEVTEEELAEMVKDGGEVYEFEQILGDPSNPDYTEVIVKTYDDIEINTLEDEYFRIPL